MPIKLIYSNKNKYVLSSGAGLDRLFSRRVISNSSITVGACENEVCLSKLVYADDAALIADKVLQASARSTSIAKGSLENAAPMGISIRKSKLMHIECTQEDQKECDS